MKNKRNNVIILFVLTTNADSIKQISHKEKFDNILVFC